MKRWIRTTVIALLLAGCSRHPSHEAQGYMEGRYTYISTSVSGKLLDLYVQRGTRVKAGDKLLLINERPERDAYDAAVQTLKESIAARDAIAATLVYDKLTFERNQTLVKKHAIQQSELDRAYSVFQSTTAQLAQANATIDANTANMKHAEWDLEQKTLYAPVDALVFDTYYRIGERTIENQAILSLLAPADIKVVFYVPETDLGGIQLSGKIKLRCDGCAESYEGRISFISPTAEYTPPVIFSNETTAKLIYRIEAEFTPEVAIKLHPGQPVRVTYST